ncbi:type II toxin-antitoxin system VapC family toxin [Mesorhizobium sp. Z1-4]|uniref:type II toxin-antitoxin system VapC family toxin n=1 Tax=Mesorhizobium sp. Z1-4 TaxID=2448478 RepID=UPI000FD8A2EF|nr:type II toxin-antitoxin system VapC family toxin [Mesorhizobium sp. Z1-4]
MLLLDTNVVSGMFSPAREPAVESWFGSVDRNTLFLSAITKAELLYGLAIMPAGKRRLELAEVIWRFLAREMGNEILEFGSVEAEHFADIAATRREKGRPISQFDAQIAAIARARGFTVATRNVRDFEECGVEIVNPWSGVE